MSMSMTGFSTLTAPEERSPITDPGILGDLDFQPSSSAQQYRIALLDAVP